MALHHITITRGTGGRSRLLIDGEDILRGVRSVQVINDVNDVPIVRIDIIPAAIDMKVGSGWNTTTEDPAEQIRNTHDS